MSTTLDIFDKLASDNDYSDFSEVVVPKSNGKKSVQITSETEFSPAFEKAAEQTGDIFDQISTRQKEKSQNNFGFLETAKDVAEQIGSKGISGALGSYGNIISAIGLQTKKELPGNVKRYEEEQKTLEKLQKGEVPSIGELTQLSEQGELPAFHNIPTSEDIQKGIESTTGIGQGRTPAGRIAGRGAEYLGEGVATGGGAKSLLSMAGAGIAGQGVREAGGPEALASGTEIVGTIVPSLISGKLNPRSKEAKDIVDAGRKLGLTEAQITPLIQGEGKISALSKVARKGTKTKELFNSIKETLGDSYQKIKNGVKNFGNVSKENQSSLINKFTEIRDDLSKTLKASPDKESAIKFIDDAIAKIKTSGASPEELINFWQDINKSVKWNSIQGGKKSLTRLKEPISEVLHSVAPSAAKDFEMTNQLYTKYSQISKKLKPDLVDSFVNKGEVLAVAPAALSLINGNPWPLASLGTEAAVRLLGREMLTNPYFQNLASKLVTNFNRSSVKGVTELVKQAQEYMTRKHPEEDWKFLTED